MTPPDRVPGAAGAQRAGLAPDRRLALLLWLLAMAGVVSCLFSVLPQILAQRPTPIPFELALFAGLVQSAVLVTLAVWSGIALGRPLGLDAPALRALILGHSATAALRRQWLPAFATAAVFGIALSLASAAAPQALALADEALVIPLATRLLYGGVSEEILLRWGFMSALLWLCWRGLQQGRGRPGPLCVAVAVLVAALLFALLHLPVVTALGIPLTPQVLAYVVIGNTVPGTLFGYLYWRSGLEAAILAHAGTHAVAAALTAITAAST